MRHHQSHIFIFSLFMIAFGLIGGTVIQGKPSSIAAQDDGVPPAEVITIEAEDGLSLIGEFWRVEPDETAPAILLMQPFDSGRYGWEPLIESLLVANYNVLAVDMRGTGETGGEEDPAMAISDAEQWLNWLSEQPTVQSNALVAIGAREGANIAVIACIQIPNCATSIVLSPILAPNPSYGYHESIDLREALSNTGSINTHSMLVMDQISNANFQDLRYLQDIFCCNVEVNLQLYPSTQDYNPDGIRMVVDHMDSAMPLILLWVDSHTAAENIGLEEFTLNRLMIVTNEDPRSPLDTALSSGTTTDFDLAIEECCYFIVEVETAAVWSVSSTEGVSIDPQTGELTIDSDVAVGTRIDVSVDVENGRRIVTATITVTDIASNPLIGEWHEIAQLTCDTGERVDVEEAIGELIFEANGEFSVTWFPFEVYVDYVGTYDFSQSGDLTLFGRSVNYFPPIFDGEGTFSIDDEGNLVLEDIWLGIPPSGSGAAVNCGHVFARR